MSSVTHAELLEQFYRSFQGRDADAMLACYAPDVTFSDPVFGELRGSRARAMWKMLCAGASDLAIDFEVGPTDESAGSAHWVANYTFSATKRKVRNDISARFTFRDGLIDVHRDSFDLWKWCAQALGPSGLLFGWAPPYRAAVRTRALARLDAFIEANPAI